MKLLILIRGPICAGKSSTINELKWLFSDVSTVDFDAFKRQIDFRQSSDWRRTLALETAEFLCEKLMQSKRTIIADVHSSSEEQYKIFSRLAIQYDYRFVSVLIRPPLEECLVRNRHRIIPDVSYTLSDDVIRQHYNTTYFVDGEPTYDSATHSALAIAKAIQQLVETLNTTT